MAPDTQSGSTPGRHRKRHSTQSKKGPSSDLMQILTQASGTPGAQTPKGKRKGKGKGKSQQASATPTNVSTPQSSLSVPGMGGQTDTPQSAKHHTRHTPKKTPKRRTPLSAPASVDT
ncbi:hypothetical protein KIPB_012780, partial [Kipferlia bialata]|eukprot:g12780.t1